MMQGHSYDNLMATELSQKDMDKINQYSPQQMTWARKSCEPGIVIIFSSVAYNCM